MSNIFDIKRFGNYFLYDLRRTKNNFGLSLLILGLMPLIVFVVYQFLSLISGNGISEMPEEMKFMSVFISTLVCIFSAGTKIYGKLTEKRAGSDFLMLPASSFEKWLSMAAIVCIALPLVLFGLLMVSDLIMNWFFPNQYGDRFFTEGGYSFAKDILGEEGISINFAMLAFLNWCTSILIFTLGAICFKRSKVSKTLLCIFLFGMAVTTLLAIFFGHSARNDDWPFSLFEDPVSAVSALNWIWNITYFIFIGGLLGGLYARIRTLKH